MRSKLVYMAVWMAVGLAVSGCKSEFERIRTSGDPVLLYEKANAYYDNGEYLRAQTLYELVLSSYRGKQESEQIAYRYAYTYYHLGQHLLAAYYFTNFAQTYGGSRFREETEFMAAYSNYLLSPNFRLDQSATVKAIDMFQEFANQYPNSERVPECNRLIDQMRAKLERKAFESAKLYFELKQYQSAVQTFDNVLKDFPETPNGEEIRYLIVRSDFLLAQNSFVERQAERYREAIKRATEFLTKYKDGSTYRSSVEEMLSNSRKRLNELENV